VLGVVHSEKADSKRVEEVLSAKDYVVAVVVVVVALSGEQTTHYMHIQAITLSVRI